MKNSDPIAILQNLIRCPSVTPNDAGVLASLESVLKPAGFKCTRLPFSAPDTPDVDNLFARFGDKEPHLCFAGHVDVVPTGDEALWSHPPFDAVIKDGIMYGRGTCDMKGSVAAFAAAAVDYVHSKNGAINGSISFLITGDEEGPAINGTTKVLDWMKQNDQIPDECLVGEPTSAKVFGDGIKIGRRGSITFYVTVKGTQGHAAYPHLSKNPIPILARLIDQLCSKPLDEGTKQFGPSTLAVSTFDVGNPASNVTPERATAVFNIRFNTQHSADSLIDYVQKHCDNVQNELGGEIEFSHIIGAECFLSEPGPLLATLQKALEKETGRQGETNTAGGTSDARFIKNFCPVIEFGPLNKTIHQVDENIAIADLEALTRVYRDVIENYFA